MTLFLTLNSRKTEEIDFSRFRTSFILFEELIGNFKKESTNILFYKYQPLQELNEDFEWKEFKFGILESFFKEKLISLKESSINYGFEINSKILLDEKRFDLIFRLLPRSNSYPYDITIDILENAYANTFEELEVFHPNFRKNILEKIKAHNIKSEQHKEENISMISRAFMSDFTEDLHNIDDWRLFYSKNPEEMIICISYGSEEISKRLSYANKNKFANTINNLNSFYLKAAEYAKETDVEISAGSICILPKDEESMGKFVSKLRERIARAAKNAYLTEEEYEKKLEDAFQE